MTLLDRYRTARQLGSLQAVREPREASQRSSGSSYEVIRQGGFVLHIAYPRALLLFALDNICQ